MPADQRDPKVFDAIVIGTGFGGAVTACRLVEAGFKICVLERGRRYDQHDFPQFPIDDVFESASMRDSSNPPPDFSRWLWGRDHGIFDVRDLDDVVSVQAAGYGGGSLIYVNVHLRPPQDLFDEAWPEQYRPQNGTWPLNDYFDLAAYMLQVSAIPSRLAKTVQLQKAAETLETPDHWFRTPLAVNFEKTGPNPFERTQQPCDMRGRCWLGCDHRAKNTLDFNYLARAEKPTKKGAFRPDIRTLAEVKRIRRRKDDLFSVSYDDLILRDREDSHRRRSMKRVTGRYVFLCAGAVNTTELLLKNWQRLEHKPQLPPIDATPLGSRYFPNSDSLACVFNCAQPHEADYGPTVTSALLHQSAASGEFSWSLDFQLGKATEPTEKPNCRDTAAELVAGLMVTGKESGACLRLSHAPLHDWGSWTRGDAAGTLVFAEDAVRAMPEGRTFVPGEQLLVGSQAVAYASTGLARRKHWFLVQDGGYPPELEPVFGIFQSPLWLRRNRYSEVEAAKAITPLRRPSNEMLRLRLVSDSLGGNARRAGRVGRVLDRSLDSTAFGAELLRKELLTFFPSWFTTALENDRREIIDHGTALALPLLGRLLGELSTTFSEQVDLKQFPILEDVTVTPAQTQVAIRGLLRQALQVLAGSEAEVAAKAARLLLGRLPETPADLLEVFGPVLLWGLGHGTVMGHTGMALINGRDHYRGRLSMTTDAQPRLTAKLPHGVLETSAVVQERVLRDIAKNGWKGELRTNPTWAIAGKRVTVHNQGGCPMGEASVASTNAAGQVHGCNGLYVMDAAAFPTSVGVNPSATIAAVAEFKIEQFIREHGQPAWRTDDFETARSWVDQQGRAAIDPLNNPMADSPPPKAQVLGLTFDERMTGFFADVGDDPVNFEHLVSFPRQISRFTRADERGLLDAAKIEVELTAKAPDLARLMSADPGLAPMKLALSGTITLRDRIHHVCDTSDSFLQFFVRPAAPTNPLLRFLRYKISFEEDGQPHELHGLKVLRDAPGLDVWVDASTLYFEIRPVGTGPPAPASRVRRGILRISLDDFVTKQMPSMFITGTNDDARRSWALVAFYRYFVRELAAVYLTRTEAMKSLLAKLIGGIHV